jgi:hypothetical protein
MSYGQYFKTRKLLVPETTDDELKRLGVKEIEATPGITMPPLPPSFSIKVEMTPARDQGGQGSCTSFGVVSCLEHIFQRDLSEAQVQDEAEHAHGDCQEGLAMVYAFSICKARGSVDEDRWPYDDGQVCWASPPDLSGAARYAFRDFGYIYNRPRGFSLKALENPQTLNPGLPLTLSLQRQMFARRQAICVSVPVVWAAWPWNGDIQMPPPNMTEEYLRMFTPPNTAGWHCIAVCGWDNSTGRFEFKNSWGTSWGNAGFGTIPYQYIEAYSDTAILGW